MPRTHFANWNYSPQVDMLFDTDALLERKDVDLIEHERLSILPGGFLLFSWFEAIHSILLLQNIMVLEEKQHIHIQ